MDDALLLPRRAPLAAGAVTIVTLAEKSPAPGVLRWAATGVLEDAGSWHDGDYLWDGVPFTPGGSFRNELALVGDRGTIRIRFAGLLAPAPGRGVLLLEGSWEVVAGTGGYARLRGGGRASFGLASASGSAVGRFTGRIASR